MRHLLPCPPCGRQGRPGQGFLAGSIEKPRGSAPRERDHRGGDHPVPSRTRQLSPPSPRVLQRKAAGGQGVALAEGAFLYARACPGRRMRRERPAGGSPLRAFSALWEGRGFAGGLIGVAVHTAPARHRGASRYRRGIVPCGPLRVLGHCPVGRSDRRRAPAPFYLYEAPARFAGLGRGPAGGSPPVGLSVFRGRSLPEDLREDFLLDRSCARHVPEDLRGLPAGLLALTWTSNLTEAVRPALSRRSAVSKGLRPGCPPL